MTLSSKCRSILIPGGIWAIPALLMVLQMHAAAFIDHRPMGLRQTLPSVAEWLIWAPVTPAVLAVARRYPVWPRATAWTALVHGAGILVATLLHATVYAGSKAALGPLPGVTFGMYWVRIAIGWLPVAALVYGAIVLSSIAVQYSQLERQSKLHEAELRTSLAQAESAVLRAQLDPHFLMNSLHSIAALVRVQQTTGAVQMLSDLGDLLRESHTRTGTEYASIADEVEFARRYLAIEQVRFQDRLVVRWTVDPQTVEAIVPRLILQPIAENAIRHGIAQRSAAGRIDIRVHRVNDTLILTVTDDGPGPQTNAPLTDGVGLSVTRTRLTRAYGDAGSVTLRRSEGGGAIAEVRVPFQTVVASGRPG